MFNSIWYKNLIKPKFSPPDFIFAPVWTFLYTILAISALIYFFKRSNTDKKAGYISFFVQLFFNFVWTGAFFMLQNIPLALLILILADVFTFITIRKFHKVSKISSLLLIPYLLWLLFATYLNISYMMLN